MAFVLTIFILVLGAYLIVTGKSVAGYTAIVATISGLIVVFVVGRKFEAKERAENKKPFSRAAGAGS